MEGGGRLPVATKFGGRPTPLSATVGALVLCPERNPLGQLERLSDYPGYTANYESVIAVAASDRNDYRARFSGTGPAMQLIVPGVRIMSTVPDDNYDDQYSGHSIPVCRPVTFTPENHSHKYINKRTDWVIYLNLGWGYCNC